MNKGQSRSTTVTVWTKISLWSYSCFWSVSVTIGKQTVKRHCRGGGRGEGEVYVLGGHKTFELLNFGVLFEFSPGLRRRNLLRKHLHWVQS